MLLDSKDKEKPLFTMIREQYSSLNFLPYRLDTYSNGAVLKNTVQSDDITVMIIKRN